MGSPVGARLQRAAAPFVAVGKKLLLRVA